MKQCPQCKLVYADVELNFCLEDGAVLVERTTDSEPATAIIPSPHETSEDATRSFRSGDIPAGSIPAISQAKPSSKSNRYSILAGVAIVALAAAFFGYRYYRSSVSGQIESIAVMPFANESGNAEVEYLSDGMTETLIGSLSEVPNLSVKGRSSVFRYKGKDIDTKTIGKDLDAQAVLYGRVNQRGDQLTLSLELLDALTENVIWSGRYERKQADVVSLQREVARDVSSKLRSKLSGTDAAKITKTYTADPEAYQLYLKGRFYWNKRTAEALKQSVRYYEQSIEKDPNNALAYSGLAETYVLYASYDVARAADSMPQAKAAAERALAIDDSLAEAHTALGDYLFVYEWKNEEAENELRRAIELKPNYATAHQWLGLQLMNVKRFDEGLAELRSAEELDPLSPIIGTNQGDALAYTRRYDEAIAQYKRILVRNPDFFYAHQALANIYGVNGMYAEAITEARAATELSKETSSRAYLGLLLGKSGDREGALKILDELKQLAKQGYVASFNFALVHLGLGEKEQALDRLEEEVSDHSEIARAFAVAPELDELRSEPRFKAVLKQMNLPE